MNARTPRIWGFRLQVTLGVLFKASPGLVDCRVQADARDNVLQRPVLSFVIQHVIGRDHWNADLPGDPCQLVQAGAVISVKATANPQPDPPRRCRMQLARHELVSAEGRMVTEDDEQAALGMRQQVVEAQQAVAFLGAAIAGCEQVAEPR